MMVGYIPLPYTVAWAHAEWLENLPPVVREFCDVDESFWDELLRPTEVER